MRPPAEIQAQAWNVLITDVLQDGLLFSLEGGGGHDEPFLYILTSALSQEHVKDTSYALQEMRAGFYLSPVKT